MRGKTDQQSSMLALAPEDLIPADHPIRRIKPIVDQVLRELSPTFDEMYHQRGRLSVPPEQLLKASILMSLYTVRSERQFCERLRYDLLFKWFLDLNIGEEGFDHSTFSKNRVRLLEHEVAQRFFAAVVEQARLRKYVSDQHFTVDGTLLEAWASVKSFTPRDGQPPAGGSGGRNPEIDFHGETRSNQTHRSTTDPQALLFRKGKSQPAKLYYAGHVLMENRNGLVVDMELTQATGFAERDTALRMLHRRPRRRRGRHTVGADKGYHTRDFRDGCRGAGITPHLAQNTTRQRSSIDGRTTHHRGYATSQRVRKRVEEIFGWVKTVGGGRKLRYIGEERNRAWALVTAATYNLVRISNLSLASA